MEARDDLRAIADLFSSLKPATEEQRELMGAAKQAFARIVETTLLMARQLANPVPLLLMAVVVGAALLLLRAARDLQLDQLSRADPRLDCGRGSLLHDPRIQFALFAPIPHFSGRAGRPHQVD
jgi:hypothetical protein